MTDQPNVVVLGAGFAGLGAMSKLEKSPVNLTLIDKNDYHAFLPLLYQVATSEMGPGEIGIPAEEIIRGLPHFSFQQATVTGIDLDGRKVMLEGKPSVGYDYLLVGLGARVNFFGTPGAAEHAFPLYTMDDAVRLKNHIVRRMQAVNDDPSLVHDGALRFCVVGGGSTGVEIAGAIGELFHDRLSDDFPNLPIDKAEVQLYELAPQILTPFKPSLQQYAEKALGRRGVQINLGEGVVAVEPKQIKLTSGKTVPTHTLVWCAGLGPHSVVEELGVEMTRGRIVVEPDLSLPGHPEVFAIGDMAMTRDSKTQDYLPQLGSVAQQAGQQTGENIARLVAGKPTQPFVYADKGTMAAIGRGAAIVQMRSGRSMTGRAAWLAWLGVHLALLSGGKQKGLSFVDWGWDVLNKPRNRRLVAD